MRCSDCGVEWRRSARFCGRCGRRLRTETPGPQRAPGPGIPSPLRTLVVAASVAALVALLVTTRPNLGGGARADAPVSLPTVSPSGRFGDLTADGLGAVDRAPLCADGAIPVPCVVRQELLDPTTNTLVAGDVAYVSSARGTLRAVDGSGVLWRLDHGLRSAYVQPSGEDVALVVDGGSVPGTVHHIDRLTGRVTWQAQAGGLDGQVPGLLVHYPSRDTGGVRLERVDPASGTRLWELPDVSHYQVGRGYLVTVEDHPPGDLDDEFRPIAAATITVHDLETGAVRWRLRDARPLWLPHGDHHGLVVRTDDEVRSLDPEDGTVRWATRVATGSFSDGTVVEDTVLLQNWDASRSQAIEVIALDATTGARRWRAALEGVHEPLWVTDAVTDGGVVVVAYGAAARLMLVELADGTVRWSVEQDAVWLPPELIHGLVAMAGEREVVLRDPADGDVVARVPAPLGGSILPLDDGPADILIVGPRHLRWVDLPLP